jgi:low affinity Fe/Cu permease
MIVNIGTTIITLPMVFLLQNSQSRDSRDLRAKLDELIVAAPADNRFVGVKNLDVDELHRVSGELLEKAGTRIDESPYEEKTEIQINLNDAALARVSVDGPHGDAEVSEKIGTRAANITHQNC